MSGCVRKKVPLAVAVPKHLFFLFFSALIDMHKHIPRHQILKVMNVATAIYTNRKVGVLVNYDCFMYLFFNILGSKTTHTVSRSSGHGRIRCGTLCWKIKQGSFVGKRKLGKHESFNHILN